MKQKLHYEFSLDLLRTLAVAATFVIHIFDYYFYHFPVSTNQWWFGVVLVSTLKFLQPVFLTASAILLIRNGDDNPGKIAINSIKKFLPIFLFWNIFFLVFAYLLGDHTIFSRINEILFTGTFYHMNMLSQIAAVYILFPFISHLYNRIDKHSKIVLLAILLSSSVIDFIQHDLTIIGFLDKMVNFKDFSIQGLFSNMGLCLLGYELFQRRKTLKPIYGLFIYVIGVFTAIQLSWLEIKTIDFQSFSKLSYVPYAHYYSSIPVIVIGMGIMWFVFSTNWKPSEKAISFVKFISKRSLGYLMVHVVIRSLMEYLHFLNTNSLIELGIKFIVMTVLSVLIVEILYRLPYLKKLVGR
jgi:surface polysaccharide O-acyltransferase-like enzyme